MKRIMNNIKKAILKFVNSYSFFAKLLALALICALIYSDYTALMNLFTDLDFNDDEQKVFALTLAICLETLPFFAGNAASQKWDITAYSQNSKFNASVGFWVGIIGFVLTYLVSIGMRLLVLFVNDYPSTELGQYFAKNLFVMCSPFLTSLLSFLTSWIVFRSDSDAALYAKLRESHDEYLALQSDFMGTLYCLNDSRIALWSSLAVGEEMPEQFTAYRKSCFDKIRSKLLNNAAKAFPQELEQYQSCVETELVKCIERLNQLSGSPTGFDGLNLDSVIDYHDQKASTNINTWKLETSKDSLNARLREMMDNSVIVAQYKSTIKPYHLEKDRW